jgi:hypothetical protein
MNNAHIDKAEAEKEKIQAKITELTANLKIAAADTRVGIEEKIKELQNQLGNNN